MKKKRLPKRLGLHRETLHKLEDELLNVAGATVGNTCGGTCCARSDSCVPPTTPCSLFCPTGTNVCF
jgi:hypothetical protein